MVRLAERDSGGTRLRSGERLTLLVIERDNSSSTLSNGEPVHFLDAQVAMYPGANPGLDRQSNAHLKSNGSPLVAYSSDQMIELVTAAWQHEDMADDNRTFSELTEQDGFDGHSTVYVIDADVARTPDGTLRIVPGSVRRADESRVPVKVEQAQARACAQARSLEDRQSPAPESWMPKQQEDWLGQENETQPEGPEL